MSQSFHYCSQLGRVDPAAAAVVAAVAAAVVVVAAVVAVVVVAAVVVVEEERTHDPAAFLIGGAPDLVAFLFGFAPDLVLALGVAPDGLRVVEAAGLDGVVSFDRTPAPSLVVLDAPCHHCDELVGRSGGLFVGPQSCHSEKSPGGSQHQHLTRKIV